MARAEPTPTRFTPPGATILGAHAHLIERLGDNRPAHLQAAYIADADDFTQRAEHLRRLMTAVSMYVDTALEDIARSSNIELDRTYLIGLLDDLTADVCGSLENAAERVQEGRAA